MTDKQLPNEDGVQIDMVSGAEIEKMRTMEKIRLILDSVRDENIVILERGLEPEEQSKLVEVTMSEIQPDEFSGLEIETYPTSDDDSGSSGVLGRMLGKSKSNDSGSKLTVIGPADQVETLHKDETLISTLIRRR